MARTVTRWDPFAELADLRSRFDRLVGDPADGEREWIPAVDVVRDNGHLVVRAEIPGVKPEEIEIKAEEGMLEISGRHEETSEKKDEHFVRRERRYGGFSRTMRLPDGVDPKKIKATTHDGLLEVTIPLPKESGQPEAVKITPTVK
jgi:HSP20 family protein